MERKPLQGKGPCGHLLSLLSGGLPLPPPSPLSAPVAVLRSAGTPSSAPADCRGLPLTAHPQSLHCTKLSGAQGVRNGSTSSRLFGCPRLRLPNPLTFRNPASNPTGVSGSAGTRRTLGRGTGSLDTRLPGSCARAPQTRPHPVAAADRTPPPPNLSARPIPVRPRSRPQYSSSRQPKGLPAPPPPTPSSSCDQEAPPPARPTAQVPRNPPPAVSKQFATPPH